MISLIPNVAFLLFRAQRAEVLSFWVIQRRYVLLFLLILTAQPIISDILAPMRSSLNLE